MKLRQWITGIVLILLVAAAIVGMLLTGEGPAISEENAATSTVAQHSLVDQRPLQTARRMAAIAGTREEQALAHEAEQTGDHEVDLSFLDALRTAGENPPKPSPETKEILERKSKAQQALKQDQDNIGLLTKKLTAAPDAQKEKLQDQIDVAKAQMDLDQNEFDDASEDLEQAGGDPQAKIKRMQAEHEAEDRSPSAAMGSALNPREQEYQAYTILNVFRAWRALREKRTQLQQAKDEASAKTARLNKRHETLVAQVENDKDNRQAAKQRAQGFATGASATSREDSKSSSTAALDSLKQHTRDQKTLADLGKRIQDEQELTETYGNWIALVAVRERAALHHMLESLLWILLVALVVYLLDRLIEHLFTGMSAENKRVDTLRSMVKFAALAVGVVVIIFIIVGVPTQTTTVLGLAGAGLTVAMKDFIVAFFGWFVLMGSNGIRVGDWIEINGVGGEVVEVGLLKTVLLETGNWSDSGHPTGRRVSFVNSFAIEGHFFNFTTSGQWMWDDLEVLIPPGQDPYPIIDGIQKLVEKETAANAGTAEAEWKEASARYRVKTLSAVPGINVRPTATGIEVHVRYITRAYERHDARKRLYNAVVELMHGKRDAVKEETTSV